MLTAGGARCGIRAIACGVGTSTSTSTLGGGVGPATCAAAIEGQITQPLLFQVKLQVHNTLTCLAFHSQASISIAAQKM